LPKAGPRVIPLTMEFAPDSALGRMLAFIDLGGPAMWAIAALSVAATALILWKIWHLISLGVFGRAMRQRIEKTAMQVRTLPTAQAEAEVGRVARAELAQAGRGLRGLELAATIGPLLGLLGTVTGMIAAFQALQTAGANADPATLAGGIWEALLTTAAGMAVAIPASIALAWFDGIIDRLRHDLEDAASRILLAPVP
jgi:biopolymer transport protein ExbB